ncbi:PKD domain-containing protein [archaeon]
MRRCVVAVIMSIILLSPAFAFIGPDFSQLLQTLQIQIDAVNNQVKIQQVTPTPTPEPTATPVPTPEATPEPTPEPIDTGPDVSDAEEVFCSGTKCGNLDNNHIFKVETDGLTRFEFEVTPHGDTSKVEIFASAGGFFHKVAEKGVGNPDTPTRFALVTDEKIAQIMIHMPDSANPESYTAFSPTTGVGSGPQPMKTYTSLWRDGCNNGIGYSPNQADSHCGTVDCCNWYQKWHVHDLQVSITQNVSINVDVKSGGSHSCKDNVTVYTSNNNISWVQAGMQSLESLDTSMGDGGHQLWATHTYTIPGYNTTFQYVKVEVPKCFNDWSYVTITDAPGNTPPNANFAAPLTGEKEHQLTFNASASTDSDGSIAFYEWQWGDGTLTNTTDPVTTHKFNLTGTFKVSLLVKDDDLAGASATADITITPDSGPPDIFITIPDNSTHFGYANIGVYYNTTATDVNHSLIKLDNGAICPTPYLNTWNDTANERWCKDPNGSPSAFKDLAEGWHVLHVLHVDEAGKKGAEDNVTVFVDSHAPDVNITSPANDTVTANNWAVVNFTTPDDDVVKFEYAVDGGLWKDTGITGISADTDYDYNFTLLPSGVRTLRIRASDSTETGEDHVRVNATSALNSPPTAVINEPVVDSYHLFVDEINVTATDAEQTVLKCQYKMDAGVWNGDFNVTSGVQNVTSITNQTLEGTHTLYLKCTDFVLWSDVVSVDFEIDQSGPTIMITYPNEGANVTSGFFEYSASDQADVDYYEVQADSGGWSVESGDSHTFSLSDGAHTLYVRSYDMLGNLGDEANVNITVDTVAPGLTMSGGNNSNYTGTTTMVELYSSGSSDVKAFYQKLDDGEWELDPGGSPAWFYNVSEGVRYTYIKAVDWAGNENVSMVWSNVNNQGPTTLITAPTGTPQYDIDDVNVTFHSDDADLDEFEYSFDGVEWSDAVTGANNGTSYKHEFKNVPEGVSTLYIRAMDNTSMYGTPVGVQVNVTSIYTNLKVDLILPEDAITLTPFMAKVYVTNYNEENVSFGDVKVNLTTDCSIDSVYQNPRHIGPIAGNSGYDSMSWKVTCSSESTQQLTGFMIYTPTNETKSDSESFGVKPMSGTPEDEEEEDDNVIQFFGLEIDLTNNEIRFADAPVANI